MKINRCKCGGEATRKRKGTILFDIWTMHCGSCGRFVMRFGAMERAILAWNAANPEKGESSES